MGTAAKTSDQESTSRNLYQNSLKEIILKNL